MRTDANTLRSGRFRAVISMALLIMVGFGIIIPALPVFAKKFGVGEAGVGVVIFAFSLTRLIGDLFAGSLIERFGERIMTAIGAAIVGLSSIAAGLATSYVQLVVLRGLGGFGSAFFLGGLFAYLIGVTPAEQRGRATSIFQASFGIGFLVGPPIGGILLAITGANVPFHVYGAVCLVCVPLCLRALGGERTPEAARADVGLAEGSAFIEEAPAAPHAPAWHRLKPLLRDPAYRAALAASALMFLIGQAQFTLVPDFWRGPLGQTKAGSGLPFAVSALFGLAVAWHAGALTDRRGRKATLIPALAITAIGTVAMGFGTSALVFIALMAVTGAAQGYIRPGPSAMVGDVSSNETRAIAVSGYRIAGDAGALIGPLVAGSLAQYVSFRMAFVAVGGFAAIALLFALAAQETLPPRS